MLKQISLFPLIGNIYFLLTKAVLERCKCVSDMPQPISGQFSISILPKKVRKHLGFLMYSGGIEREHLPEIKWHFLVLSYVSCWSVTKKNVRCDFLNFWRTPMFDGKFLSWLCCFKIAWLLGIFGLLWRKVLVFYYSFFFRRM